MFADATKSIVISSSRLKGLGARVGSIGYVTTHSAMTTRFLSQNTQFINGLVVFPIRVSFIRYGYEKERPKPEGKDIIGVLPIISELRKNSESENILRTFIEKFSKTDFDSHLWLKTKLDLLGKTDYVDICVIAPVGAQHSDLRTCSTIEFDAWFKSFMFKESVRRSISNFVYNDAHLLKLPDAQLIDIASKLRIYFESAKGRDVFMDYILATADRRENFIKCVRMIRQTPIRKSLDIYKRHTVKLFTRNRPEFKRGTQGMNVLFCKQSERMFIDEVFDWKLKVLAKSSIKNIGSIISKARKTKEVIESMSREVNEE